LLVSNIESMANKSIYSKRSIKLGKWLREQRELSGYSLRSFEAYSGWSRSVIGKIESGHRRVDVIEFLDICEVLECDPVNGIKILSDPL